MPETTNSPSTAVSQGGNPNGFAPAAVDTHIPALDDAPDQVTDAEAGENTSTEGQDATEVTSDAPETEDTSGGESDETDLSGLIAQFAKETGLDPNNPGQKKTLERLANKELFIRKLRSENETLKSGKKPEEGDGLTEFERKLKADAAQKVAAPVTEAKPAATDQKTENAAAQPEYGDGFKWQNPHEAYADLNKAWEAAAQGDYSKVNQVEAAVFARRFSAIGMPLVQQLVQQQLDAMIKDRLGDVVPHVRQSMDQQRQAQAKDFAVDQLAKTKGYEDISSLDTEIDGDPITFDGEEFRNTPMNRILAENPWILSIREQHPDRDTADRLTYLARYRAAHKILSAGKIDTGKAKQLVDAGKQLQKRTAEERTRQGMNAGTGAGTQLSPGKGPQAGYVNELLSLEGEPTSFASL